MSSSAYKFIDIAFNGTDGMFSGCYHGKQKHAGDIAEVLTRARLAGVQTCMITGGSLSEAKEALELAESHGLYSTVGLHPTRSKEMEDDSTGYLSELSALIDSGLKNRQGPGRVVAIGECGLDYDRLHFSPAEIQRPHFASQLALAKKHSLPLFLHSRAAHEDFALIMREHRSDWEEKGGVVHSFTGTIDEMKELVEMGLSIGINGCSLKSQEALEVVREVPLDRLLLETDAPYCSMTTSHASNTLLQSLPPDLAKLFSPPSNKPEKFKAGEAVKGRLEPCGIGRVAWAVAKVKGVELEVVEKASWANTVRMFGLD